MNGPVVQAIAGNPAFAEKYTAFRSAAHEALGEELTAQVRDAVAQVHGLASASGDDAGSSLPQTAVTEACLAYARRIPFQHTAITDAEAATVVEILGEPGYVALSVVAALADAECRAAMVDLPMLAGRS